MISKEKAIELALKARPGGKLDDVSEEKDYYIISIVPENYKPSMGLYFDGAVAVNKKTGKVQTYNPFLI